MTKCQGLEMFQRTNRTSDPRNEKMWHNISSGSVSIEVAISLQHMKLTSGSESISEQMTGRKESGIFAQRAMVDQAREGLYYQ